jgi:hypothetical protein
MADSERCRSRRGRLLGVTSLASMYAMNTAAMTSELTGQPRPAGGQ